MRRALLKSAGRPHFDRDLLPAQTPVVPVRLKVIIRGAVQGVGFRPFVFRLAEELKLSGWVNNSSPGVFIEVEGERPVLEAFLARMVLEKPPRSSIQSLESTWLDAVGFARFEIRESQTAGDKSAWVMPDIATCPDCLREILDPKNRRYRYPFTNCTHCGPRFSIVEALPYDRANTSMKQFTMCLACQREYDNPNDRRFHAQPNACPVCGPRLELWSREGEAILGGDKALRAVAQLIRRGKIVVAKGIGGFHLLVDARNEKAVSRLRERKQREEKPFAVLFPTVSAVKSECAVSLLEERLLGSPEAPIVLLKRIVNPKSQIVNSVAPGNPNLGAMLPSNPLHHLLMLDLGFPVVTTSGNLSDEPICTDERDALVRLGDIADAFLVHNRPIVRHEDDSIVRVMLGHEMVLRRARGYAPLPIQLRNADCKLAVGPPQTAQSEIRNPKSEILLAVGAHLKNAVALAVGDNVFISQHIGDLETEPAFGAFRQVAGDLPKLYDAPPEIVAADLHPDYLSTKYALERASSARLGGDSSADEPAKTKFGAPRVVQVQHHIAHVLSCLAENEVTLPALGVAWDGTGYGTDGTVWGGEFFRVTDESVERVAHLRPFHLPGADKAVKQPRRVALGLLYELYGEAAFEMGHLHVLREIPPVEMITLRGMLQRRVNSPATSSVGRLFDAVASLINLRHQTRFEGQAAMELEFALEGVQTDEAYAFRILAREDARPTELGIGNRKSEIILDWAPVIGAILSDVRTGVAPGLISAKFHNALAEALVLLAKKIGEPRVALSGGCFQNRYLTERTVTRLREEKFAPYWHQRVPPNDGGIALGQVIAALRQRSQIGNPKS
jgi:hydrogenase maturation protein HypF